jgi:hypothetical protein
VASAIPEVPPVITATLFSSFFMMRVFQIRVSENSLPPARADGLTVIQAARRMRGRKLLAQC